MENKISFKIFIFYFYKELKVFFSTLVFFKILGYFFTNIHWIKYIIFVISLSITLDLLKTIQKYFYFSWTFDNDSLSIKQGIFFKKYMTIKSNQIKGIQITSPWFLRILYLRQLTIFLPSTGDKSKIVFDILTPKQVKNFNSWQEVGQKSEHNISSKDTLLDVNIKQLLVSSIFSLNYLFIFSIIGFIDEYISRFNISILSLIVENYHKIYIICLLIVASIISSFIKQFLNYYFLKIKIVDGTLMINNGVISDETVTIHQTDIIGFIYSQNLGQNFLNLWTVKVIIKNYDIKNQHAKISAILPFATLKDINNFEKKLYGEVIFFQRSLVKSSPLLILNLVLIILSIFATFINFLSIIPIIIGIIILYLSNVTIIRKYNALYIEQTFLQRKITILHPVNIEWEDKIFITHNICYKKIAYSHNPISIVRCLSKLNSEK